MSGSVAKETRRQIRRAFGSRAVEEVETIAGDVRADVASAVAAQVGDRAAVSALSAEVARLRSEGEAFRSQGWKARLRWIVGV